MAKKKSATPALPANAFIGRATKPRDADVAAALGSAKKLWDRVVAELEGEYQLKPEWNSYSVKYGWALRMKKKDRNVVYLGAYQGGFAAQSILGAKALAAAKKDLPAAVFAQAKKYPEGTAIRVEMRSAADVAVVKKLVEAKLQV
jgi:hypothetical protein